MDSNEIPLTKGISAGDIKHQPGATAFAAVLILLREL